MPAKKTNRKAASSRKSLKTPKKTAKPALEKDSDGSLACEDLSRQEISQALSEILLSGPEARQEAYPSNVNSTAYRIFMILVWLNQGPLSVEELNERFFNDPEVGKTLSNDSIWLYINTLKALGCEIRRPMRSTQFKYELVYHPFGIYLNQDSLNMLIEVKCVAEKNLHHNDVLMFDRLLKKIISRSAIPDRERFVEELFTRSRSQDYDQSQMLIEQIQAAIDHGDGRRGDAGGTPLLEVGYNSPIRGHELLVMLPDELVYQRGVMYVHGYQAGRSEPSTLRLERITHVRPVHDRPDVLARLRDLRQMGERDSVCIRFWGVSEADPPKLDMGEVVVGGGQSPQALAGGISAGMRYVDLRLETRKWFQLRQKILETGLPFWVLGPESFRQDMMDTLRMMGNVYEGENVYV